MERSSQNGGSPVKYTNILKQNSVGRFLGKKFDWITQQTKAEGQ
ncbi:hypothetical protein ADIS_4453 [Lunatimonas lonarensis]|uniref:Uncharacterized protein n=1 Tax=Lunatimonas lonarensis TaxID=1232681 RepID=R7ZMH6_9BACT|nr:hypothetical protein ADIS_4453 [Lunatimonas lonarensis]